MSKFVEGQKVMVREDLESGRNYNDLYFAESMEKYRGKEFEVLTVNCDDYILSGDDEVVDWYFNDEMLVEAIPAPPALPTKVLELGQIAKLEIYVERVIVNDPATIMFYRVANFDEKTSEFISWSDTKKVVAKVNKDIGDTFEVGAGVNVALLKAYRKEIDKQLRKF
ncbi:hypothetical protein [Paenibacillus sp. Mc5Re-14]|uniref:hypothetical protein n=1 Tax=Paenibacillus sp. Mc5Re-14 TaxID=1030529 RepID=UPI000B14976C|nr:hypothetical protein [Paenibacillus sp. Mc5Re-14]